MTKINDLATVIVTHLVRKYPVDIERYELYVFIRDSVRASAGMPAILTVANGSGSPFYGVLAEITSRFQEAIEAYQRVFSVPFRQCTLKELRLTQRLLAATEEYAALVDIPKVERETLVGLHTLLWAVVIYKLGHQLGA